MQGGRIVQRFANRRALFLWGFAAVFLLFLVAMTLVLVRDGGPPDYRGELLMVLMIVFWGGTLGFFGFAASHPCITVTVNDRAEVTIAWRHPFRRRTRTVSREEIASVSVIDAFDSDGEQYFYARIVLQDGSTIDFAEAHYRSSCLAQVRKMEAALDRRAMATSNESAFE